MVYFQEEKLRKIVQTIVKKHGISEETDIILSKGSDKGDGYLGEIVRILVKGEKRTLNLIAKIAMNNEKVRATFPYAESFKNEILSYENVVPELLNLQIEAECPSVFNPFAGFYSASSLLNQEYLILQDLKTSKFEMLGMRENYDHDHTKAIFTTYAKFHGVSFALKILKNKKFRELGEELFDVLKMMFNVNNIGEEYPKIWEYIRKAMREKGFESKRIDYYVNNSLVMMQNMINIKKDTCSCLLHGDCWSNNLMFRYKTTSAHKEVEEIKLLDWQACRIGLPVFDLTYTLYSGASKEILANLETYLKIYHETLSQTLRQFDLDVDSIYPFEEMKRQWKKYYHYGAILSGPIWKFRSFGENQGVDPLTYESDDGSSYIDAISSADCDTDYLCQNIKELLHHLDEIDNGKILI